MLKNKKFTFCINIIVVAEAIIIRQFSSDLNVPIKINKRKNDAGIARTEEINSSQKIEFDGYLLADIIYNLMNGKLIKDEDMIAVEMMINNEDIIISEYRIQIRKTSKSIGWNTSNAQE